MAEYQIVFRPQAIRQLAKIAEPYRTKLATAIRDLKYGPRPVGSKKLAGGRLYRIRISDYRVLYEVADKIITITVTKIAHRKDAYRP